MVDFPGVCRYFKWGDPNKLCGPAVMAANPTLSDSYCCYGHTSGWSGHKAPHVGGKPFKLAEHMEELTKAGLTTRHAELANGPKGQPKTVGNALLFEPPSFG